MSEKELQAMRELDDAAEKAGGFVSTIPATEVHYDYRKMMAHCKAKNIEPQDMTIRELNQFVIE